MRMAGMSCPEVFRRRRDPVVAALACVLAATSCGRVPQDAEGTLAQVERGVMRVGVSHDPPYVVLREGRPPSGPECDLVMALAKARHTRVEWVRGGHEALMRQVGALQLDVVVGGHDVGVAGQPEVAWSREYRLRGAQGPAPRQLALPPGEHAWRMAVDGFLFARSRSELRKAGVL
jgi:polar amino acid transport system substrate-binding protein